MPVYNCLRCGDGEPAVCVRYVDELEAENKWLREILQGLVKNRNVAMKAEKPTIYFENMQPFWIMAEEVVEKALEGGGKR